jgi:hypothetical protein
MCHCDCVATDFKKKLSNINFHLYHSDGLLVHEVYWGQHSQKYLRHLVRKVEQTWSLQVLDHMSLESYCWSAGCVMLASHNYGARACPMAGTLPFHYRAKWNFPPLEYAVCHLAVFVTPH